MVLLWPKVRQLEERKDVGRALSAEEQKALLDGLKDRRTPHLPTLIPLLLLTGMRAGEALSLTWGQVDLMGKTLTVGRAKTANGTGRIIPINDDLASILAAHRAWFVKASANRMRRITCFRGERRSRPIRRARYGHNARLGELRKDTGVSCRLHDLRHTFATRLAENGVSESTMLALMGHMSRAMLERYSHIRMTAKTGCGGGRRTEAEGQRRRKFGGSPCESPCSLSRSK